MGRPEARLSRLIAATPGKVRALARRSDACWFPDCRYSVGMAISHGKAASRRSAAVATERAGHLRLSGRRAGRISRLLSNKPEMPFRSGSPESSMGQRRPCPRLVRSPQGSTNQVPGRWLRRRLVAYAARLLRRPPGSPRTELENSFPSGTTRGWHPCARRSRRLPVPWQNASGARASCP